MKNLICFLILSVSTSFLYGDTNPELETSNVIAFSGLKIRTSPGMQSKVIEVVPFGESVEILEKSTVEQTIEWIDGTWIKVSYMGTEGYVFDGFLTDLPIPTHDFELSQNDLDLSYTILAWAENNFDYVYEPDTITSENSDKMIQYLQDDIILSRYENDKFFKATLELPETSIGEAYNLVKSMLLTKNERKVFEDKSVFISNKNDTINKIKINLDIPVELKLNKEGTVKITVVSFHDGCGF